MDCVELNQLFLSEVNYQYEIHLNGNSDSSKLPLSLLLLGVPLDHYEGFEIKRSIIIPIRLQVDHDQNDKFIYELDQARRRVNLIRETNGQLEPCGIMVINEQLYDYEKPIKSLQQYFEGQIKYLFTYDPELRTEMDRKLNGFILLPQGERKRIGYKILYRQVDVETQNIGVVEPRDSDKRQIRQESLFVEKLTRKIDDMIRYLDCDQLSDLILRKISLLVSELKRGPTTDMEETIINKEVEINALRIICAQWEMGIELSGN